MSTRNRSTQKPLVERKGNNKNTQTSVAGTFVAPKTPTSHQQTAKLKQTEKSKK